MLAINNKTKKTLEVYSTAFTVRHTRIEPNQEKYVPFYAEGTVHIFSDEGSFFGTEIVNDEGGLEWREIATGELRAKPYYDRGNKFPVGLVITIK